MTTTSLTHARRLIGERIAQARQARGLSLEEVAERTGVAVDVVDMIEQGEDRSADSLIVLLAELDLLGGVLGAMAPAPPPEGHEVPRPEDRLAQAWSMTPETARAWAVLLAAHRSDLRHGRGRERVEIDDEDGMIAAIGGKLSLQIGCTAEEALIVSALHTQGPVMEERAIDQLGGDWQLADRDLVTRLACDLAAHGEARRRGRLKRVEITLPGDLGAWVRRYAERLGVTVDDVASHALAEMRRAASQAPPSSD